MAVTQTPSLSLLKSDPLRNFKFQVTIYPTSGSPLGSSSLVMGFMTVSGIATNIDVIPYREGGMNTTTQKMPGQADFNPVTFSHGVILGAQNDLKWIQQLFTVMQGSGATDATTNFRCSVEVAVLNHPVTAKSAQVGAEFMLYNAWPTSLAYSDLDAGANQLFIAQMALAYEGFAADMANGPGADASAIQSVVANS
jgi:phage tail-like protein